MSDLRCKFKIDNDLGKFAKALHHLHALKAGEELQVYVQRHELYKDALELYRYEPEARSQVLSTYANYLNGRNHFKEAAIGMATSLFDSIGN